MLVAHAELRDGCADLILDSLRERFDAAVGAIAHAKSVIGSGESSAEHVLSTAGPETVEAWQQLGQHITVVAKIAGIASQFGCRQTAAFSLVELYGLADNHLVDDRALAVTTGSLVADSALLMQPDRGRTTSPYFRCGGLKLHSTAEMQRRYDEFAAAESIGSTVASAADGSTRTDASYRIRYRPTRSRDKQEVSAS